MKRCGDLYNVCIKQGVDYREKFVYRFEGQPIDLTGVEFYMEIRDEGSGQLVLDASSYVYSTLPEEGVIEVAIPAPITRTIEAKRGLYDILLKHSSGEWERLVQGRVTFSPSVTEVVYD